tara:strand:+ start:387 stop:623 length:237 start_codon:yes stop_codon:yes gene_type:complete
MRTSNCCDAPIILTDLCAECKEHCDELEDIDKLESELDYVVRQKLTTHIIDILNYSNVQDLKTISSTLFENGFIAKKE